MIIIVIIIISTTIISSSSSMNNNMIILAMIAVTPSVPRPHVSLSDRRGARRGSRRRRPSGCPRRTAKRPSATVP